MTESPATPINTGLSNIVARSAGLRPSQPQKNQPVPPDPRTDILHLDETKDNSFWIDRARVFQSTLRPVADECGTVDSSINDLPPASIPWGQIDAHPPDLAGPPAAKNYCQRQGRCTTGCLPGARQTLNKQLMRALFGAAPNDAQGHTPPGPAAPPDLGGTLTLTALAEVDHIEHVPSGGYRIHYSVRDASDPHGDPTLETILAERVILAAGVVGTVEILFRSRDQARTLPHVSESLGRGFSTNGDWIGFVRNTTEAVRLVKGPVTTSYALFNRDKPPIGEQELFHTVEDNGIPPALASNLDFGLGLAERVQRGQCQSRWMVLWLILRLSLRRARLFWSNLLRDQTERIDDLRSEDEHTAHTMCVTAFGHAQREGRFRLGTEAGDTALRVDCVNGPSLADDPVYAEIKGTAKSLAPKFTGDPESSFEDPFESAALAALGRASLMITHPLGGCVIGPIAGGTAEDDGRLVFDPARRRAGVVDEYGRVYDTTKAGHARSFYEGLYVADGAVAPSALGVNPSLTISALALRIADKIIEELPE